MKWEKRGRELDEKAEEILNNTAIKKGIYIWGAGFLGEQLGKVLDFYGCLKGYIDNDVHKQNTRYCGYLVKAIDEYIRLQNRGVIVLAVSEKNKEEIIFQLEELGFKKNHDFYEYLYFVTYVFPIYSLYYFKRTYIYSAQISLTERCTLSCKKCAHACYNVSKNHSDLDLEYVFWTVDVFFSKIDYIQEFVLIGGEPLLYKQLPQIISYVGEKYRKKICIFSITTNGTILPTEELLNVSKKFNVLYRISNYSVQLPHLMNKYLELKSVLEKKHIRYWMGKAEQTWMDYGFEYVDRSAGKEELVKIFDECKTPCREIRGNKYYFCIMARSVSENLGYNIGQDDYLDLDTLQGENWKKELLEFNLGFSEKGYLEMCNHCHGKEAYKYPIPVAEQMSNLYI